MPYMPNMSRSSRETVRDGSYVTAIIPAEAVFAVYAEYEPEFPGYLGAGVIVVVGAAGFVIAFLVRKKNRIPCQKKEEAEKINTVKKILKKILL